ncbi:MAG TPA: hypothetical protein VN646_16905 [Candidatus Acidoferrum sp.]|nr:hypothetical protein [Candidatus Acidoferrum sp.]
MATLCGTCGGPYPSAGRYFVGLVVGMVAFGLAYAWLSGKEQDARLAGFRKLLVTAARTGIPVNVHVDEKEAVGVLSLVPPQGEPA